MLLEIGAGWASPTDAGFRLRSGQTKLATPRSALRPFARQGHLLTGLDIEFLDEPCVLFRILLSDASELLRTAADRLGCRLEQAIAGCDISERPVDFGVEAHDDRRRRSQRHERAVP